MLGSKPGLGTKLLYNEWLDGQLCILKVLFLEWKHKKDFWKYVFFLKSSRMLNWKKDKQTKKEFKTETKEQKSETEERKKQTDRHTQRGYTKKW